MNDEALVEGIRAARPEAIRELVDQFHAPILRYLWQATGVKEDAEDLTSQTLLRARFEISRFRGEGSLRGWVFRIAYRELLRYRRSQAVRRFFIDKHPTPSPIGPNDDAIVLLEALRRIPPLQRDAFLLTEVEGMSTEEAAATLGVPAGTVKSRCHHARQRLRDLLSATYGEPHAKPAVD